MTKFHSLRSLAAAAVAAATVMVPAHAGAATVDATPSKAPAGAHQTMPKTAPVKARSLQNTMHGVGFCNSFGKAVWVVTMRYDPAACAGFGDWQTKGWFMLQPGEEKKLMDTDNQYAAFYAKTADGTQWTGNYGPGYLYNGPFQSCIGVGANSGLQSVGFKLIDLRFAGSYYFINLVPGSA